MKDVQLDYFDFFDTFKPMKNPLNDNAPENGCMFETYGVELEFVVNYLRECPKQIWTVMTNDNGNICIGEGFHLVNRLGYLITEEKAEDDVAYYIE